MPGRRRRKRRQPQHEDCESLPKRQGAILTNEDTLETPQHVTLHEHLCLTLPRELSMYLKTVIPRRSGKKVPLLTSFAAIPNTPSFCIGRLSLTPAHVGALLSQIVATERNISTNLRLYPCNSDYIEFCDVSGSVYVPIHTTPHDLGSVLNTSSKWYSVRLVLCNTEREENEKVDLLSLNSGLEQGMGDTSTEKGSGVGRREQGDGRCEIDRGGRLEEQLLASSSAVGLTGTQTESVQVKNCVQIEDCGMRVEETGVRQEEEEGRGMEGGESGGVIRRNGCVECEVWVGGAMCEPCDPNALPSGGNLAEIVKMFHPHISVERRSHFLSWNAVSVSMSIVSRIEQFYKDVKIRRREMFGEEEPAFDTSCIPGLTAELRGYQERAVQWMVDREKGVEEGETRSQLLHPLWKEFSDSSGKYSTLYCNPHTGRLTSERYCHPPPPRGGILADEMGLGKTVEVLALVLAHRAPETSQGCSSGNMGEMEGENKETMEQEMFTQPSNQPLTSISPSKTSSLRSPATGGLPAASGSPAALAIPPDGSLLEAGLETTDVVQCVCGATSDDGGEYSEYVQCERCNVWQHSECACFDSARHPSFVCIKCLLDEPLTSRATLIISPQSILQQWREEIDKHTSPNSLSVMHYEGVKTSFVSPYDLAVYDVVLVSYETLACELNYAKSHEVSRVLRRRKRYGAAPSPLPAVKWWRMCLDEAQMVESAVTKPAEMCLRLQAIHRWCVTGTPIQRDLGDLYGLVLFLDMEPYSHCLWYRRLITEPYLRRCHAPMVDLFSTIMWRNTKEDVAEELQLPEQEEQIHWLTFSLVEGYFYKKQMEMCRAEANKVLSRLNNSYTLNSLTQATVQKIMTPLHSLRRACCHPQMVRRGGYIPINSKKSLTMPQLLDKLILQAKAEAREGLRRLVLSFNGLAGLYILREEWSLACEMYLQAIATWTEYKEKEVECDRLQRIHTLENLAWLVEEGHCTETLADSPVQIEGLKDKAHELHVQFMGRVEGQVRAAIEAVVLCKKTIRDTQYKAELELAHYLGREVGVPVQCEDESASLSTPVVVSPHGQDETTSDRDKHTDQPTSDGDKPTSDWYKTTFNQDKTTSNQGVVTANKDSSVPMQAGPTSNLDTSGLMQASSTANPDTSVPMQASSTANPDTSVPMQASSTANPNASIPMQASLLPNQEIKVSTSQKTSSYTLWRESDEHAAKNVTWFEAAGQWVSAAGPEMVDQLIGNVNLDVLEGPSCRLGDVSVLGGGWFKEMSGVQFHICNHIEKLRSARLLSLKLLHHLLAPPSDCEVQKAVLCHLSRREEWRGLGPFRCGVCVAESALVQYGTHLFSDYYGTTSTCQEHGEGSRGVHVFENITRSILNFLKHKHAPKGLVDSGKAFMAYFDAIKKEYDALRTLWQMLNQRMSECDELRLAGSRMRYMTSEEVIAGTDDMSAVHPMYWVIKMEEFEVERTLATNELTRALGQVVYLNNLAQTPEDSAERGSCPICTRLLGTEIVEWGMLPCGHPLCMDCELELTRRRQQYVTRLGGGGGGGGVRLSCPLCRFSFLSSEINTVRPCGVDDVDIKGSPSTKILGVVQTLFTIRRESPTAKTLVFSTWLEILTLISASLTENGLSHAFLKTSKTFQENLSEFKKSETVNILLLPLQSGSKGLNIIEATHVILVEPGLNISAELQAIGRVHRMGQTKPTTVHRFMIRDSVEEKIHHLLNTTHNRTKFLTQKEGQSTLTLRELETLFN